MSEADFDWKVEGVFFYIEDVFIILIMEFVNAPSVYESHPQQTIFKETLQNMSLKATIKVF